MRYTSNTSFVFSGIALLLVVVTFAISTVRTVYADSEVSTSGERILVIHDGGVEHGILTEATTVREAFQEASIPFDENDLVEPGLDEKLVAKSYDVNIYRARPVTVVDGAVRKKIMSAYRTPAQIATHAGMALRAEDEVTMGLAHGGSISGASIELTITRATPVRLVLYGNQTTVYTQTKTVGALLDEKEITIGGKDRLSVPKDKEIVANMKVELWREGKQTVTREEKIDFDIEQIQDVDRPVGYRQVKTPGLAGKRSVTYEIEMKNGKEVSRKEIQSVTLVEPKKQVEVVGAKSPFDGDLAAAFAALRQCESGGNYANKNNPLYRGAYQFSYETWANNGGYRDPADAPPALQDAAALALYKRRGWQPWPACSKSLGLR